MPFDENWPTLRVCKDSQVTDAIKVLEASDSKVCLVVAELDGTNNLIGTITDGDIRRAILGGINVESECSKVMNSSPYSVSKKLTVSKLEDLLVEHQFRHLPIVSDEGNLLGLYYSELLVPDFIKDTLFVIMAGGFGTRLRPYTETLPKPMLEIEGKPILQHIIEKARGSGFYKFVLILHYLPESIKIYFGDGSKFGVSIEYVTEEVPLGTAGGLSLLDLEDSNYSLILVTNGDLISDINFQDIVQYHIKQNAFATMSVREHKLVNEFGTVEISGNTITGFKEKPVTLSSINAGIYVLNNEALSLLVKGEKKNMPDLFMDSVLLGHRTVAYYLYEGWNDVGRVADLKRFNIN